MIFWFHIAYRLLSITIVIDLEKLKVYCEIS